MPPKRAKEQSGRRMESRTKKQKTQCSRGVGIHAKQIRVQIVMLSGQTVASLSVEPSCSVKQLIDKLPPLFDQSEHTGSKIPHLFHATRQLAPYQYVGDCVPNDSLLTLTFEATPIPLRSVERNMSQMQAAAAALKLESELEASETAVVEATATVDEARTLLSKLEEKIHALQNKARSAEASLEKARVTLLEAQDSRARASRELMRVKQDQRTGYERVVERLQAAIAEEIVPRRLGNPGAAAMHDLCDLHLAGEISDEELTNATDVIVASASLIMQVGAMKAIVSSCLLRPPPPSRLRAVQALVAKIVASPLVAEGSATIPWISLAQAICMNSEATAAVILVDGVVARGKAMASAETCPIKDLMYPVLELLRSASLPAASELEAAIGAVLEAARSGTAWIEVARAICKNGDVALARPLVNGVMARAQVMRPMPASVVPACPFLDLVHPILEKLRVAGLPVADEVQAKFKAELQAVVAEPVPDAPDYAMRKEANIIGGQHPGLRDFLLSPVELEATFDCAINTCVELQLELSGFGYGDPRGHWGASGYGDPRGHRSKGLENLATEVRGVGTKGSLRVRKLCGEQWHRAAQLRHRRDRHQQLLDELVLEAPSDARVD